MAQSVKSELAQAGGGCGALEAAAERGAVERAAESGAEHVVVVGYEVLPLGEPGESLGGRVGHGQETSLPALCRPFRAVAERAMNDESAVIEVYVLPAQSKQLAEAQTGEGGNPVQIGVLVILIGADAASAASIRSLVARRGGRLRRRARASRPPRARRSQGRPGAVHVAVRSWRLG